MNSISLPILDFSLWKESETSRQAFSQQLFHACCSLGGGVGFFLIENHGISQKEVEKMFSISRQFFVETAEEEKTKFTINSKKINNQGYSCIHSEKLDYQDVSGKPDYKEAFNFGKVWATEKEDLPNVFAHQYEVIETFSMQCHNLCVNLLQAFALALQIPDSCQGRLYFSSKHKYEIASGDILRILHYPPLPSQNFDGNEELVVRAGAHTDYGSLTLLFQDGVGGLQIQSPNNVWMDITPIPGCIVVNVGDLMSDWTCACLPSTTHRVVARLDENAALDRYSIAYFCHPEDNALLEPCPSPLITKPSHSSVQYMTAKEHLFSKLQNTYRTLESSTSEQFQVV